MKTISIIILALLLSLAAKTQITFKKEITRGAEEHIMSVIPTADGGYAMTVVIFYNPLRKDIWVIKTNQLGDTVWSRTFAGTCEDFNIMGDRNIVQAPDGGYTLLLYRSDSTRLLHLSASGDSLWEKALCPGYGTGIINVSGNRYAVSVDRPNYIIDILLTDSLGTIVWKRSTEMTSSGVIGNVISTSSLCETIDGGLIICGKITDGYFYSSPFLSRLGPGGDSLWFRRYNDGPFFQAPFFSVDIHSDGGYYACGWFQETGGALLMRFNAAGDTLWSRKFGGSFDSKAFMSCRTLSDNRVVVCGSILKSSSSDSSGVFLGMYDDSGNLQWTRTFWNGHEATGYCVERAGDDGYILCGDFQLSSSASYHGLLIKTDANGCFAGSEESAEHFNEKIYPNPVTGDFLNLDVPAHAYPFSADIAEISGKIVRILPNVSIGACRVYVGDLAPGIYLLRLRSSKWLKTFKVVRE